MGNVLINVKYDFKRFLEETFFLIFFAKCKYKLIANEFSLEYYKK